MKKILIGLAAVAMLAMIPAAFAIIPPPCVCTPGRTPGYWKHDLNVLLGNKGGSYNWYWDDYKMDGPTLTAICTDAGYTPEEALAALTPAGPHTEDIRDACCRALNLAAGLNPDILI